MPIREVWERNQLNNITFVMVDASNTEVPGLGNTFTLTISKNGGPFNPSAGAKAEIGNGWYSYIATPAESDTLGTVSIIVNGAGCIQQNLEYVVTQRNVGCIPYTYTVLDSLTLNPLYGVEVWISKDLVAPPQQVVWHGNTDTFGVARDIHGNIPCLDIGTFYAWKEHSGYIDDDNPSTLDVS